MKNNFPDNPIISCPIVEEDTSGYITDNQSISNVTRKDKFKLIIDIPCALQNIIKETNSCSNLTIEKLILNVWGYLVPEFQINNNDVGYGGQVFSFSNLSRPAIPPITVNFTVDNNFKNYFILYKWLDFQNDEELSIFDGKNLHQNHTGRINEYSSVFTIVALDEYDSEIAKWEFRNAYPISLGSLNISPRESTELETTVTFRANQVKMILI